MVVLKIDIKRLVTQPPKGNPEISTNADCPPLRCALQDHETAILRYSGPPAELQLPVTEVCGRTFEGTPPRCVDLCLSRRPLQVPCGGRSQSRPQSAEDGAICQLKGCLLRESRRCPEVPFREVVTLPRPNHAPAGESSSGRPSGPVEHGQQPSHAREL